MNTQELMNMIAHVTPEGGEWCSVDKACTLAALIAGLRPNLVVEVGVWMGGSLVPMALAARELGPGKSRVVAIDPWQAGESVLGQTGDNADWWRQVDHEAAFRRFCDRLRRHELEGVVEVRRCRSDEVDPAGWLIGLLHVDGNHGEQAVRDVERFAPQVEPGGVCVLDDIGWAGGAVGRAADLLVARLGFRFLYPLGTGAVFQRVS